MTGLIIVLFALSAVIFATLYVLLKVNITSITNQLNKINSTKTNSKLFISSSDRQLKNLAVVINKSLEEKQKTQSEYKRMEQELRQAIANMSHDLRTPLTSIMGYMQLIEDDGISDEERKQYIDIIKKRAQILQALIMSFYDLSRLESGEYKFEIKPLNISNVVCDTIASYYKEFSDKNIEPDFHIDDEIFPVNADENAVRRIVSNLIQNILRYGSSFVSISINQQEGHVSTIFTNDAPGLTEEDADHLFERFFTADRTRTAGSTGLGLSIARQLVEQMGHSISTELNDGKLSIEIMWKN